MLCVVPPISIGAVFYGRYLRKLSNLTQEAIGDMSKVRDNLGEIIDVVETDIRRLQKRNLTLSRQSQPTIHRSPRVRYSRRR